MQYVFRAMPSPRMFDLLTKPAVVVGLWLSAAAAAAAPTLLVEGELHTKPARISLSPIQLWDTTWWLVLQARPDGAALTRLEYRIRFLDDRPQSKTGGIELSGGPADGVAGRVAIRLPTREDYERPLEARMRVHDAAGNSSDWVAVEFPPEKQVRPPKRSAYTVSAQPEAERRHRIIGTVEYEAGDSTTLGVVRDELGRQAKAAGGDAAVGVRLVRNSDDKFVFAADVVRYLEQAKPTPTAVPLVTDRELGEIVVPYERH
jgi:hypothetical protein